MRKWGIGSFYHEGNSQAGMPAVFLCVILVTRAFLPEISGCVVLTQMVKTEGKTVGKTGVEILEVISSQPQVTREELSQIIGLSVRGIEWNLDKLKKNGKLQRVGAAKGGYWKII